MATKKADKSKTEIIITKLTQGTTTLRIIGETPLYQNRMAAKAMRMLLVGSRKKTSAERIDIKHDPLSEYQDAVEKMAGGPTAIGLKVTAIKKSMCEAALETAGVTKTSSQRLLFIAGAFVPLYGVPKLKLDVVRQADIAHTPDIRSRPYFEKWGAEVTIKYITPQLSLNSVVALLCNAGVVIGVGDARQGKGALSCGTFRVLGKDQNDPEWNELVKYHGRKPQLKALEEPEYADDETHELMEFFYEEVERRAA